MTIETRCKVIIRSRSLLELWIVFTMLEVLACGHSLLTASIKAAYEVLILGLLVVAFKAVLFYLERFPFIRRLSERVSNAVRKLLDYLTPEKLEAWSTKACVVLIGGVGVFFLVTSASSGWLDILIGLLASIVIGVALWVMMSLVDMLKRWTERTGKKFYGALILLTTLGAFWFALVLTMNWLSGTNTFIWT
jgi:hypothetical protein